MWYVGVLRQKGDWWNLSFHYTVTQPKNPPLYLIAQFSSSSFVFRELELTKLIVIRNVPVFVVKVLSFPASSVVRVSTFLRFGWGILL